MSTDYTLSAEEIKDAKAEMFALALEALKDGGFVREFSKLAPSFVPLTGEPSIVAEPNNVDKFEKAVNTHALRVGNVENVDDVRQDAWVGVLANAEKPADVVLKAIRQSRRFSAFVATPFSKLSYLDEDGEEVDLVDQIVDEINVFNEEVVQDEIEAQLSFSGWNDATLKAKVEEEITKALNDVDLVRGAARIKELDAAWQEYLLTVRQPDLDEDSRPMFKFPHPKAGEGKGEYQVEDEDEKEWLEQRSDIMMEMGGFSYGHHTTTERKMVFGTETPLPNFEDRFEFDTRRFAPGFKSEIEIATVFSAVRKSYEKPYFGRVVKVLFTKAMLGDDIEIAQAIRLFSRHISRKLGVRQEEVVDRIVDNVTLGELNLREWFDEQDEAEEAYNLIDNIIYAGNPDGDVVEEYEEEVVEATEEKPVVDVLADLKDEGDKPWETAVFRAAFADAFSHGLGYKAAQDAGWTAWRKATYGEDSEQMFRKEYHELLGKGVDAAEARKEAAKHSRFVSGALTFKGEIVGMFPSGVKLSTGHFVKWQEALLSAKTLTVKEEKFEAFLAAANALNDESHKFAVAFQSAQKLRA